ncbi:5195_t:CDS:2 [Racocetra persica]|uniref:5195_t:CDS:1 n=1 Tax=Racocetra persica TaxID=160502 RepID=A0ACA9M3U8_9GLOM|nr:5195_t:CDS:2 [Racocetra persica]
MSQFEEVYNEEYEVEDCHVHENSPKCTPCKKCEKMAEKSEVLKENS